MPKPSPERRLLVAVVDDHRPFRAATCRLLEGRGFETCSFGSVVDFISSGAIARIHCLLLDVSMPEIDGFALQDCLRDTNYEFPVIFCTGQDDDEIKHRALAKGAVSFLQKPVKADLLIEAIQSACEPSSSKGTGRPSKINGSAPSSSRETIA